MFHQTPITAYALQGWEWFRYSETYLLALALIYLIHKFFYPSPSTTKLYAINTSLLHHNQRLAFENEVLHKTIKDSNEEILQLRDRLSRLASSTPSNAKANTTNLYTINASLLHHNQRLASENETLNFKIDEMNEEFKEKYLGLKSEHAEIVESVRQLREAVEMGHSRINNIIGWNEIQTQNIRDTLAILQQSVIYLSSGESDGDSDSSSESSSESA